MASRRPKPIGVVLYSEPAARDYSEIYDGTVYAWGEAQAERYADLLDNTASDLAEEPHRGKRITGHPENRAYFVKWKKAKHGHYIIYRAMPDGGTYVVRILHGRMDIPRHLGQR